MAQTTILEGHARKTLFSGVAVGVVRSTGLGVCNAAKFSRFTGLFSIVGSATLQWKMGVQSGNFQVTSVVAINSGPYIFDQINYGCVLDVALLSHDEF
jgi:hypothetical protein